jgi:hypothetical protein
MRLRFLVLCLLALSGLALLPSAHAQRGPGYDPWEFLGQKTGGFGQDGDSILINQNEDWHRDRAYRKLRFTAEGNDVELTGLRLIYINGYAENVPIERRIPRGQSLIVDLPGERSYLRQIDMRYRSGIGIQFGSGGIRFAQGSITVHGERAVRPREPDRLPTGARWSEIDTQTYDRRGDRVEFRSDRGDGRFGQIRLRAVRDRADIRNALVRFRNGEVQNIRVDQRLEEGEETRALDLEGDLRAIDRVVVNLEPRRRPGRSEMALLGVAREGRPGPGGGDRYAQRGWTFLGEQTVGFQNDRDEIEVRQDDNWFRDRRFNRLHVIAEGNDVYMNSVRIFYRNGYSEDFRFDRMIPAGSDLPLDLRGDRSYIKTIVMNYRSRPSFSGRATMKVYGESFRR